MNNNDYTDIRIVENIVYIKVYGIDSIFMVNIDYYKDKISYFNKYNNRNIFVIMFNDVNNIDKVIDIMCFTRLKKLSISFFDIRLNERVELKPEVGYEIINKLKEILSINLIL